jgi:limonene-1,2-epoxide hydrolase
VSDPESIVRQFMSKMEKLDYDAALELVADDVEYTNVPMGTVHGPDGIRSVLVPFFSPTVSNEWVIRATAVNGSTVFMERLDRHQLPGGWAELPVVGVFEVRDNKIAEWRDYFDLATIQNGFASNAGSAT